LKVLFLTRYDRSGASSRMRAFQFIPFLKQKGWSVSVSPLFPDNYINDLYNKRPVGAHIILGYFNRLLILVNIKYFDVVWVEKELFPYLPAFAERILNLWMIPYVVDYDDATYHQYDCHHTWIVRKVLGKKIDNVMNGAKSVITGNRYLTKRAQIANAKDIKIIPTVIDLGKYSKETTFGRKHVIVGWIGTPITSRYLDDIYSVLESLKNKFNIKIIAIGYQKKLENSSLIDAFPWTEETEVESIKNFDIGIMPLRDKPFENGKCGYKLIQYMACRLPVVASPVGVNTEIVNHGQNGYLAKTTDEWKTTLSTLILDKKLRIKMGLKGYEKVSNLYSLRSQAHRFESILRKAAD